MVKRSTDPKSRKVWEDVEKAASRAPQTPVVIGPRTPRFSAEERAALEWAEATLDTMVRYGCAAAITEGIESSNRVHATTLRKMLEEEE
jgi:hypothetical protein